MVVSGEKVQRFRVQGSEVDMFPPISVKKCQP